MDNTTIEERIFHFRTRNNWSQAQLGEKIEEITGKSIGRDVISNYEKGRRKVPSELVPVLAQIFDISTDELFYKYQKVTDDSPTIEALVQSEALAKTDLKQAYEIAIKALQKSRDEILALRDQAEVYKNEIVKHKRDAEEAKAIIEKVRKNIAYR